MNKNIIYTVAAIIVLIAIIVVLYPGMLGKNGSSQHEEASSSTTEQKEVYTCPMHPSVISDRPGACPVCGMALVKKTAQKESSKSELAMLKGVSLSSTQRVIANISTTPVEYQTIEKEINAIGVVDVAEPLQAKISARFRGRIETLYANFTGEAVKQGQKLFDLYSPDLVSAEQEFLLALNAQSEIADALYSTEIQQRLISAARDRLRLTFGMTESQLVDIETSREVQPTISYFSPISGTVISKNVQEGEYVDEGSLLYQLADLSRVWAYLDVYEKDVRFLSLNQIVHISTESYPGEMFTGKITFIDPVLNPESRTVRIRTEFANPHNKLKPQMWVKAHIILPAKSALVVPTTAILSTGKRNIVWIEVKENSFEPREVMPGLQTEGYTEILSNLSEGESVVVTGSYLLESESQLQQPGGASGQHQHEGTPKEPEQEKKPSGEQYEGYTMQSDATIIVDGKYSPDVIHAQQGKKFTIAFERHDDSPCTDEVVFQDFKIRKKLTPHQTTLVELPPMKTGEYKFSCGMNMVHGTLTVHK